MVAILFWKHRNLKLATIFQDFSRLFFKQLAMVAILFFKMRPNVLHRHVIIAINISCKFSEDIFINECDIKVYVKT